MTQSVPCPRSKRITDILLAGAMLLVALPLFLLIAALIKLSGLFRPEDRGPVFRSEIRISDGRAFRLYKFRFIRQEILNAEKEIRSIGRSKVLEQDEYCTAVGGVLKRWYLDELPQLFSILRGDLSWVGPRPFPLSDYKYDLRLGRLRKKLIRAGLTGLFQSRKGNHPGKTDCDLDNEYIATCRILGPRKRWFYDMGILTRTLWTIAQGKGL